MRKNKAFASFRAGIVLLCALAILLVGCSKNSGTPKKIRIGVAETESGPYALEGKFVKQALAILLEEVNTEGGVEWKGKKLPVEFLYEDYEGKPEVAANVMKKFVGSENVLAIIGPPMSGCMLAGGPIAQAAKIPAIGTTNTNIKTTQIGDFIFRACFIDAFQATVASKYFIEKGFKKVAILSNNAEDYSTGLSTEFKVRYPAMGGVIATHQTYAGSDVRDFNVQLNKIKSSNPDAIFMPVYYMDVPLILSQARQMGITCPILGTDSWDTPEIVKLAGPEQLRDVEYISAFSTQSPEERSQKFTKKFREKYNEEPNANAAFAYDSGLIVLEGIRRAKTLDGQGIRDAMAALKSFSVATGSITFDERRNPIKDAHILAFDDKGNVKYVTTVRAGN